MYSLNYFQAVRAQLAQKEKLETMIPELEQEIADIRFLWRLMSIPGTKVESNNTKPGRGVAITVDSRKAKSDNDTEGAEDIRDKTDGAVADGNEKDEKEVVYLNQCGIKLIIPKSLRRQAENTVPATDFVESRKEETEESDTSDVICRLQSHRREVKKRETTLSRDNAKAQRTESAKSDIQSLSVTPPTNKRKFEDSDVQLCYARKKLLKRDHGESNIACSAGNTNVQSDFVVVPAKVNQQIMPAFEILDGLFNPVNMHNDLNKRLRTLLLCKVNASKSHPDQANMESNRDRSETFPAIFTCNTFPNETVVNTSTSTGVDKPVILAVPTVVSNDSDKINAHEEKSCDVREITCPETSGMKLRTLVAGSLENMELEEVSSADNIGYNFRSADENVPHSLSSSQSSNAQADEFEGYEEMKPDQPIMSVEGVADDTSDSDSDIEVIELEDRKLVIDLTD